MSDGIDPVWAVVAGRMGSSRLPGKTLADLAGRPSLWHIVQRLRRVDALAGVVVATTDRPEDDAIRACARDAGVPCHSGSSEDVLARTLDAARSVGARTIVQITGDCPLVDPGVVAEAVAIYRNELPDYVANVIGELTFPNGLDVEVFATDLLAQVEQITHEPRHREHVSLYIYEHPERFRLRRLAADGRRRRPELRLTLDTAEDLQLIRAIYEELWPAQPGFRYDDVLDLLDRRPALAAINAHVERPVS